jgi:hypothetical protein
MATALYQAIQNGIQGTNFFNGRLLSAEDLRSEQKLGEQTRRLLGRSLGDGVAYGLEVSIGSAGVPGGSPPVLHIQPGLAVNRSGHAMSLAQPVDLSIVPPVNAPAAPPTSTFANCQPLQAGSYVSGEGVYLLTLSPASYPDGRAPVSGLGNITPTCSYRYTVYSVRFGLIQLTAANTSDQAKTRNRVAYQCFTPDAVSRFLKNPYGTTSPTYGLVDDLRTAYLTDCDVPLAILHWTTDNGIDFADNWAARRRVTSPSADGEWSPLLGDRRRAETEAMLLQFQEQVEGILDHETGLDGIAGAQRFDFLPPLGFLPVKSAASGGFDPATFFGAHMPGEIGTIDAGRLRELAARAVECDPIELAAVKKIQLYFIWENLQLVKQNANTRQVVVFATPELPYSGVSRFGFAHWNRGRFSAGVI